MLLKLLYFVQNDLIKCILSFLFSFVVFCFLYFFFDSIDNFVNIITKYSEICFLTSLSYIESITGDRQGRKYPAVDVIQVYF
jgi:hypothetical protein